MPNLHSFLLFAFSISHFVNSKQNPPTNRLSTDFVFYPLQTVL